MEKELEKPARQLKKVPTAIFGIVMSSILIVGYFLGYWNHMVGMTPMCGHIILVWLIAIVVLNSYRLFKYIKP